MIRGQGSLLNELLEEANLSPGPGQWWPRAAFLWQAGSETRGSPDLLSTSTCSLKESKLHK